MAVNKSVYYKRLNKWADALVSKKYKQIKNQLRDEDNGRCCLGVACDVSGVGKWNKKKTTYERSNTAHPPRKVLDYFGFKEWFGEDILAPIMPKGVYDKEGYGWGNDLAFLNDKAGYTFGEIAKIIRKFAEIKYGPNSKKPNKSKA